MEFLVIIEQQGGQYRALIPSLSDLSAVGSTSEEAVQNVQCAAEKYLATVELRTVHIQSPQRYSTAQDWIEAVKNLPPFDKLDQEHWAEIEAERKRQYEEANREAGTTESD